MVSWTHPEKAVSRLNSDALVTQLPSSSLDKGIIKMSMPDKPKSPKQLFYTDMFE